MTTDSIAVQKYGALIIPSTAKEKEITLVANIDGSRYTGATTITAANNVGDTVILNKV